MRFLSLCLMSLTLMGVTNQSFALENQGQVSLIANGYTRSLQNYTIPDLPVRDHQGRQQTLQNLIQTEKPVIVDFIYATCTTICPVMSVAFSNLQRRLGEKSQDVVLISVTIDPEHDTPQVLKEYRAKFSAKPGWTFLTGQRRDIDRIMQSFDAYFRDKMDHQPLKFISTGTPGEWVRLNGFLSTREMLKELKNARPELNLSDAA